MDEVPKPSGVGPILAGSAVPWINRPPASPPPIPTGVGAVMGGCMNICADGQVTPIAQQLIQPSALQQIFGLAQDVFNMCRDLNVVSGRIGNATQQLGDGWPTGAAATNAVAKYVKINGCFDQLSRQTANVQTQAEQLGQMMHGSTMSLLQTLGIGNATCAALMAMPFGGQIAAKASAYATLARIVGWLMTIKSAVVAIAEAVNAIKQMTGDVNATATGLGTGTVPAGYGNGPLDSYGAPTGYGTPAGYGTPTGYGTAAGYATPTGYGTPAGYGTPVGPPDPQSSSPTVYNSGGYTSPGTYASGWTPVTPGGGDGDGARVTITVSKDGEVKVEAPDDGRLTIDVDTDIDGDGRKEHSHFDIKPS